MALTKKNIKVISEELIKPSCPTPNHLRYLPASLFDHVHTPTLTPLIFFYSQKYTTNNNFGPSKLLDRLKRFLPDTLSMFYPLAGRIYDANHFICNDEGVPYVQVVVDKPLMDVVYKAQASELDVLLTPYGQRGYTTLMLAIQVNVFACGGLAIGVELNHAISNVFGIWMFVKTWASIANGRDPLTLLPHPNFNISKLFPPPPPPQVNQNSNMMSDRHVTKWFVFSEAMLNSLRLRLFSYYKNTSINNNDKLSPPSLIMVLSAFIWSRVKIACYHDRNDIPHHVSQVLTMQSKVSPPDEQSYYFGNMIVTAIAKLSMVLNQNNFSNESLMGEFLEKMKESIARTRNVGLIRKMQEGKEDLNYIKEYLRKENNREIVSLGFNNLQNLPLDEADFGWGKPIWVTFATLMYKNLVCFFPNRASSKDVVAYINLSRKDMTKLEADAEFNSFLCKALPVTSKL